MNEISVLLADGSIEPVSSMILHQLLNTLSISVDVLFILPTNPKIQPTKKWNSPRITPIDRRNLPKPLEISLTPSNLPPKKQNPTQHTIADQNLQ
jgi:hypothetical protein